MDAEERALVQAANRPDQPGAAAAATPAEDGDAMDVDDEEMTIVRDYQRQDPRCGSHLSCCACACHLR